ncbi:MAG TPA: hypothetical protein VFO16_14105 [Pseudonocardiaceae bacterium]|nr:hypothetical protein [Pseudonocardiaceae bacterium]
MRAHDDDNDDATPAPAPARLPQDEYSRELRSLRGHPEAVEKNSRVEVEDFYGNLITFNVKTINRDSKATIFIEKGTSEGGRRIVLPPEVAAIIYRHATGISDTRRSRGAVKAAATRQLEGIKPFEKKAKEK